MLEKILFDIMKLFGQTSSRKAQQAKAPKAPQRPRAPQRCLEGLGLPSAPTAYLARYRYAG